MMKFKRFFLLAFFCFSLFPLFPENFDEKNASAEVPSLLEGIWQGSDRLLMFSSQNEFAVVLRLFYQWYNDRASEPSSFREIKSRDRNDATSSESEYISVKYITILENSLKDSGIYWLSVKYPHEKEPFLIPVCVIDGKLYLDFLIKGSARDSALSVSSSSRGSLSSSSSNSDSSSESESDISSGFYRAASSVASSSGITIAPPLFKNEVVSYFVNGSDIYKIRYWLSDMEYSDIQASFTDDESGTKIFSVDKFLKIGSNLYQCTTGRSTKIRNVEKFPVSNQNLNFDSDKIFAAIGEPYLEKVPDKTSAEDLLENVAENNKRRKPAPKPLFPVSEINFHWKEITELEKYNPYTWNKRNLDIHK